MLADVVVAALGSDALGDALPAIHQAGLGHTARVMRAERGDLRGQLRRAGIPVESGPERLNDQEYLLMVSAAGRSPVAATLLLRLGARAAWIVTPSGFWHDVDDAVTTAVPASALPRDLAEPPGFSASEPAGIPVAVDGKRLTDLNESDPDDVGAG